MSDDLIVVQPVIPTVIVTAPGPQGASGDAASVFYAHAINSKCRLDNQSRTWRRANCGCFRFGRNTM
jgi:hypothetical protein